MQITFLGVLFFLLLVTVLVAAHELGHFWFARLFKMEVEEFAIGLGRPYWVWMKRRRKAPGSEFGLSVRQLQQLDGAQAVAHDNRFEETEYTVRPIPFGGFVRIKGMAPQEDGSEIHIANGFYSKPPWQRFLVLLAGPLFSVLAGVILLTALYTAAGVNRVSEKPVVDSVLTGKSADHAGFKKGDRFLSVDGTPVSKTFDVVKAIRERPEMATDVVVDREGKEVALTVTPYAEVAPMLGPDMMPTGENKRQGRLGLYWAPEHLKVGLAGAFTEAISMPGKMVVQLASRLKAPAKLKDEVGGPITILKVAQQGVESGAPNMVFIAAMLSISLGIFNLLPLGMLDGGQMMVAFFEMLRRGKRLSFQVQSWIMGVGMAMVFLLIGTVLFIDIGRLGK